MFWESVLDWYVSTAPACAHNVPPTDSIVSRDRKHDRIGRPRLNNKLTKGDAVGPSRTANSSSVNESFGTIIARMGMSSKMTIGNPIAAANVVVSG